MLVITEAKVNFTTGSIEIELASGNGVSHDYTTTLQELEKAIVDLTKVRLMAIIQQEKGVKLSEPVAQELVAQAKKVRNILMPQEDEALKAS